ncbi:DUF1353 domain-containing protein [Candidatus Thiosymbion oneisti]|uniref:DUF1353 domain-containing protein n=1 Tax=Candidatus Thiosymbion oneisti TaxID=589554 RepID=UPI0013FDA120|nr:DUF1353 domain-containing protein [Candidatus Thiosymbion oneisti]
MTESYPKWTPVEVRLIENENHGRITRWINRSKWELLKDFEYHANPEICFVIPKGFISDGASIPKFFHSFLNPCGVLFIASVIHDFACEHGYLTKRHLVNGNSEEIKYTMSRKYWDNLFLKIAKETNDLLIVNYIAWCAVRLNSIIKIELPNYFRKSKCQ